MKLDRIEIIKDNKSFTYKKIKYYTVKLTFKNWFSKKIIIVYPLNKWSYVWVK